MLRDKRMDRSFLLASFACLASHATRFDYPSRMWIRSSGIESNDLLCVLSTRTIKADLLPPEWAMRHHLLASCHAFP